MAELESDDQFDALSFLLEPLKCKHLERFYFGNGAVKCVRCEITLTSPRS